MSTRPRPPEDGRRAGRAVARAEVVPAGALTATQRSQWIAILRSRPDMNSPFLRPEFALAVAGARDDAFVAVLRDSRDAELGYLPFMRGRWGIGHPIGYGRSNAQAVVVPAGVEWDARRILRGCGLREWTFSNAVPADELREAVLERHECPLVDLRGGYERYVEELASRGSGLAKEVRRKRRRLERELGPISFTFHEPRPDLLETMMDWKSEQYRRTERHDRFAESWNRELLRRLLATEADGFGPVLSVLRAGERVAAIDLSLRSDRTVTGWFAAYDMELRRGSPGLLAIHEHIRCAAENDVEIVELGTGGEDYKLRFANASREYWSGRVASAYLRAAHRGSRAARRMVAALTTAPPTTGTG